MKRNRHHTKTTGQTALSRLKKVLCLSLFILTSSPPTAFSANDDNGKGWYAGIETGIPMAMSTSSSFGGDKTRIGWSAGAFFGKRYSEILSVELHAKLGRVQMSPRDCCTSHDNRIGLDGRHYFTPVLNMRTLHYSDLLSKSFIQSYGMYFNFNILPIITSTPGSWTLELSPSVTAFGNSATVYDNTSDSPFVRHSCHWNVGLGCNLSASYRLSPSIGVGIYTGLTFVTGDGIDGMPRYLHNANTVWDSGIRLTYHIKKGGNR